MLWAVWGTLLRYLVVKFIWPLVVAAVLWYHVYIVSELRPYKPGDDVGDDALEALDKPVRVV